MVSYIKKKLFAVSGGSGSSSTPNIYTFKQTITAAQMATIGTSPLNLISSPGANIFVVPTPGSLCFRKLGGTTNGYTFNASSTGIGLSYVNGAAMDQYNVYDLTGTYPTTVTNRLLNGVSVSRVQTWTNGQFGTIASVSSVYLAVDDAVNPTAGDNDIIISFTYSLIDVN